jgi:hypothetical protein
MEIEPFLLRPEASQEPVFAALSAKRVEAFIIIEPSTIRVETSELAIRYRLPSVGPPHGHQREDFWGIRETSRKSIDWRRTTLTRSSRAVSLPICRSRCPPVRFGRQSENGQGARPDNPGGFPAARQRGDRIARLFAAAHVAVPGNASSARTKRAGLDTP